MKAQLRTSNTLEGIDLDKLSSVVRTNWFWLLMIFLLINSAAVLYVRYTKNLYESSSELKLDVRNEASELGIKGMIDDPSVNLISGEIEIIQSKLFLSRVLEYTPIEVSYFSVGRVLNEELFTTTPFIVSFKIKDRSVYNQQIYVDGIDETGYKLKFGEGKPVKGIFGKLLSLPNIDLTLYKDQNFIGGDESGYFFVINSKEALISYLVSSLTAEPLNYNANTIRIAFKDHNPHKAKAILQKIDTLYLHYSNEQKNLANKQKIDWLSSELGVIEKKMEGYEDYFENFTLQNRTTNLDADLAKTVLQINQIDSQRYYLNDKYTRLNQLYQALKGNDYKLSMANRQYLPDLINKNLDELFTLILSQEKLKMSYNEITFAFREREKVIENLRSKTLTQLEELIKDANARLLEQNKRKKSLESAFANIPDKNTQFTKNMRFYKLNEQLYLLLMQSKSEFEIMQAGSTPDFKILSPASLPVTPISPKKGLILGAGFVSSLVVIVVFIGIFYLVNNKISGLSELENAINLPVLGVVPSSRYIKDIHKRPGLFALDHPKSMVSEALRTIRTNLEYFNVNSQNRIIAISSTVSGEGKSFIAMNLGAMIAVSTKKVILLDLDMRKSKTNLPIDIKDPSKGISTILIRKTSWEECIAKTQLDNMDYIPSGPHPPNPSELLLRPEFLELLDQLKTRYDIILLDTPPVGLLTDGIMAMKHADLCIYIFRANYSKRQFISNLHRLTAINTFSKMTMVLNALPNHGENRYGYGYYEEWQGNSKWPNFFKK